MKHVKESKLRAFYDGALNEAECTQVQSHLALCPRCAKKAALVQKRGQTVNAALTSLDTLPTRQPVSSQAAQHRLKSYIEQKKEQKMLQNIFSRHRRAWIAAALVIVFVIPFAFAPVRTLAGNFLALFRVQKITFIEVNPADWPDPDTLEEVAYKFESIMQDQIDIQSDGEIQEIDEATARSSSVFPARFPTLLETEQILLRPQLHIDMQIDLPLFRALLDELGREDIELDESLAGAEVSIDFPTSIAAMYGECRAPTDQTAYPAQDCTLFMQMPAPGVSAPPELDINHLGQIYLQLLGLDAQEAERFSQQMDWTSTLLLPLPNTSRLAYKEVNVDGVVGTLLYRPTRPQTQQRYVLTWIKNDIVYALNGLGSDKMALEIAESLQ